LGVLRVLIEHTLEISSVVKDSTFPDPSLAKEVKDSSLTILAEVLFSSELLQPSSLARGRTSEGFLQVGEHLLRRKGSICLDVARYSVALTLGMVATTINTLLQQCLRAFFNKLILSSRGASFLFRSAHCYEWI
jgi:hypothetical protein